MATALNIIGFIFAALCLIVLFACFTFILHYLSWFHWKPCKHCGHNMEYRGLKEDNENGYYLFHCPKCGAWQQIPKEQFFRDVEESEAVNLYNNNVL
jgi:hypothetical protein